MKMVEEIYIKIGNVLKKKLLTDIDWFGVDGKYAYAEIKNKRLLMSLSLKELEGRLNNNHFIRVHQSYMVNLRKIDAIDIIKNVIIINGKEVPIGRSYKTNFLDKIEYF